MVPVPDARARFPLGFSTLFTLLPRAENLLKSEQPVPAATVLVVRDGANGLEVFMVRRHHQIDFASGALVFPGGKTDPEDEDEKLRALCDGPDDALCVYRIAAIREAFEECGVLLARTAGEQSLLSGKRVAELQDWRDRIHKGEASLHDLLTREQLRLAGDVLVEFAHWVTPDLMSKRFDTWFFLAPAPRDQLLVHDGHESVDSVWIQPKDAIRAAKDGTHTIIFPTLCNIEKLAASHTVSEARRRARQSPVVEVLPRTEKRDDGTYLVIPEEAGYPVSSVKLPERLSKSA